MVRFIRISSITILLSFPVYGEGKQLTEILKILSVEHPEAKTLAGSSSAHKAHADASGILPDPKVGFAYRNYPTKYGYALNDRELNTPTMTGMELSIAQEFPFPGKLSSESRVAHFQQSTAGLMYEDGVNLLAGDLLIRLNRFHRTFEKSVLNGRIIDLLNTQNTIVQGYYSSGVVPQTQLLKANIVKTEAQEREIEYKTAGKDNEAQMGYFALPDRISMQDLRDVGIDTYLEENQKFLFSFWEKKTDTIESSPRYRLFIQDEKKLKEQAELTKYSLAPQTEVFFAYMKRRPQTFALDRGPLEFRLMDVTEYRGDLFSFGLNMRIPVWSALKWDAITGETEHNAKVGGVSKEKFKAQLSSEFERSITVLKGTNEQIEIIEKTLIPQMEKSISASLALYSSGKANLQESVIAKIEVLNVKIRLVELKEKRNEYILQTLKLIGKVYMDENTPNHHLVSDQYRGAPK